MKLVIVAGDGTIMGETKLSQQLLKRPEFLSERINAVIKTHLDVQRERCEDDRIVEIGSKGLESLDEDGSIMDVPLNLKEACSLDFSKHVDSIVTTESDAREEHRQKYGKLNYAQENAKRYDARYKERPLNRMRVK